MIAVECRAVSARVNCDSILGAIPINWPDGSQGYRKIDLVRCESCRLY